MTHMTHMTRNQALHKLKDRMLTDHDRERLHQYIHFLDTEHVSPTSAKRPTKKSGHNPRAAQT
jgi:hypothetical protein